MPEPSPAEAYASFRSRQATPALTEFADGYGFGFDDYQREACAHVEAGSGVGRARDREISRFIRPPRSENGSAAPLPRVAGQAASMPSSRNHVVASAPAGSFIGAVSSVTARQTASATSRACVFSAADCRLRKQACTKAP